MLGLVLCGGQSSRMGTDKGLLTTEDNITWAKLAFDKLAKLGIRVMVSINKSQMMEYLRIFPPEQLTIDDDSMSFRGPLAAVLGAHIHYPGESLFVLACDMPLMDLSVLTELYRYQQEDPVPEAFVFTIMDEPEPLCSIYTHRGLSCILDIYRSGGLHRKSMKNMLGHLPVLKIAVTDDRRSYFKNCNER